jgi:tetratricopeptide (TPR) repeat protein
MDTDLPAEVSLLEKQSEVTSRLAAIMGEVAEASKKRVVIERDIKAAQAALEALNQQRGAVESDIAELKSQLDSVNAAKAAEDKSLDELRAKLETRRADLEKLAALPQFIADIETKTSGFATLISNAALAIEGAQKRVNESGNTAGTVEKSATDLMTRMAAARAQAEEAQEQLKGIVADSKSAKADAAAAAASIAEMKTTLTALQQLKAQVDAARNDLKSLSPAIEAKRAQAAAAVGQLDKNRATRDAQLQAAAGQVGAATPQASAPAAPAPAPAPAKAAAPTAPGKAAPTPAPAPKGKADGAKVDIDVLVAAGRVDEALRAARELGNGSPDPDSRMLDAAERLRESGNAAAAAKACEKLVTAGNNSSSVRYGLALAYVDLKRFKEAMPMFDALSDPEYGVLRENGIGLALRGLGRADEAAQHFSKALEIPGQPDGQYRDVLYNLADLYESRGDQESLNLAMWSFEEIQAGAPDYRDVGDRIASLKDQLAKIEVPEPNPVLTRDGRGGRDNRF